MVTSRQTTSQAAFTFAAANKKPATGESSWDQMCGSLMFRFGTWLNARRGASFNPTRGHSSAIEAARNSGHLNPDASKAPRGAFHFWDIGEYGHVGLDLSGKGKRVFMATFAVTTVWGKAIGICKASYYTKSKGARYMGWSTQYAGAKIAPIPAKPKPTPKPTPKPDPIEEIDMTNLRLLKLSENQYLQYAVPTPVIIDQPAASAYGELTNTRSISKNATETTAAWEARKAKVQKFMNAMAAREYAAQVKLLQAAIPAGEISNIKLDGLKISGAITGTLGK